MRKRVKEENVVFVEGKKRKPLFGDDDEEEEPEPEEFTKSQKPKEKKHAPRIKKRAVLDVEDSPILSPTISPPLSPAKKRQATSPPPIELEEESLNLELLKALEEEYGKVDASQKESSEEDELLRDLEQNYGKVEVTPSPEKSPQKSPEKAEKSPPPRVHFKAAPTTTPIAVPEGKKSLEELEEQLKELESQKAKFTMKIKLLEDLKDLENKKLEIMTKLRELQ